jgi:hypothetical protein
VKEYVAVVNVSLDEARRRVEDYAWANKWKQSFDEIPDGIRYRTPTEGWSGPFQVNVTFEPRSTSTVLRVEVKEYGSRFGGSHRKNGPIAGALFAGIEAACQES